MLASRLRCENELNLRLTKRASVVSAVLILGIIGLAAWYAQPFAAAKPEGAYRVAKLERGNIIAAVASTGTINPISIVIVGSQLSGQVIEISADYNDSVKADQILARLNADQLRAKADAARADLAQARALARVQEANLEKNRADQMKARAAISDMAAQMRRADALVADAELTLERQQKLVSQKAATEVTLQAARTAALTQAASRDSTSAQMASAEANLSSLAADEKVTAGQLASAIASIAQREAVIRQIEVDIHNSEIRSPVNGVVVQRNIELGQTVAASLQAPTLFLVAENLENMVIYANVDETDVGRVKPGQPAPFTVNAFPGRSFEGRVQQVRLGSQTIQNVVIYTAVIAVENPDRVLLPGMTANLRVLTEQRNDVLRLPNSALRWRPAVETSSGSERPAQGAPPAASPLGVPALGGPPAAPAQGNQQNAGRQFAQFAERIKGELKLDSRQSSEVDTIFEAARQRAREIASAEATPAQRRENFSRFRIETAERVKTILTVEQQGAFEAIKAEFAPPTSGARGAFGRVHRLSEDGHPQAITVRLGATDGTYTEILEPGTLKAGDDLIVGGGPKAPAGPSAGGPRFGF